MVLLTLNSGFDLKKKDFPHPKKCGSTFGACGDNTPNIYGTNEEKIRANTRAMDGEKQWNTVETSLGKQFTNRYTIVRGQLMSDLRDKTNSSTRYLHPLAVNKR